jgi:hypothetical protein
MRTRTTIAALALLALVACKGSTDPDPPPPDYQEDTFSSNTLSSYTGYSDGGANWGISDGLLTGAGPANQSVLIRNGVTLTDAWVETISQSADDGGLVLRFQSATNYYLLAFRDDAAPSPRGLENLAVYHHDGSAYNEMWVKDVSWLPGTQMTIRFEAVGNKLRVYLNGALQVELTPSPAINDPNPYLGPGGVGVRHYGADASWITRFETFRWRALP